MRRIHMEHKKIGKRSLIVFMLVCLACSSICGCTGGKSKEPDEATKIVIDEINRLESAEYVLLEDLEKTKERYNSLTDSQKENVSNYATLLKLEDNYEEVGKIPLTPENYSEYLWIGYKNSFSGDVGRSERGNDAYENLTITIATQGMSEELEFENVTIEMTIGGGYFPLSRLSGGKYGLRAGTEYVDFNETVSISCDASGIGTDSARVKVNDTKYGKGAFASDPEYSPDITLTVTKISGTVLPKK